MTLHAQDEGFTLALCENDAATLDDLREAVTTLEDTERIARRVLGGAHPITEDIEAYHLRREERSRAARPPPDAKRGPWGTSLDNGALRTNKEKLRSSTPSARRASTAPRIRLR